MVENSEKSTRESLRSVRSNSSRMSRSGSFMFLNPRASFIRSSGERGAGVEIMRGIEGADWEGKGSIARRKSAAMGCGCLPVFGGNSEKMRLLLIKGPFCFVYVNEQASAPKYAISLAQLKARIHHGTTIFLETSLGDIEYEISLKDGDEAKKFSKVVSEQAKIAETEEIRKNLGHESLLKKRASIRFAESVALKKLGDQPSEPLGIDNATALDCVAVQAM